MVVCFDSFLLISSVFTASEAYLLKQQAILTDNFDHIKKDIFLLHLLPHFMVFFFFSGTRV
jgi:hypothetical protein